MLSNERLLKLYRDMVMIRRFEEVIETYAANGTVPGFVHLSIGQEACQAGVVDCLKKTDYKFPDHRGHGAICLCGTDPKLVMAEIFGKATGINHGRGGSMHVNDLDCGNMGFNGIQGSTMVTCLGTAFNAVYNHTDAVTAVFMGDGTLGEGTCHESMNMAATWKLPVIYCLVNNQYAISTKYTESHPQKRLKTWGEGYEVPASMWMATILRPLSRLLRPLWSGPARARVPPSWSLIPTAGRATLPATPLLTAPRKRSRPGRTATLSSCAARPCWSAALLRRMS